MRLSALCACCPPPLHEGARALLAITPCAVFAGGIQQGPQGRRSVRAAAAHQQRRHCLQQQRAAVTARSSLSPTPHAHSQRLILFHRCRNSNASLRVSLRAHGTRELVHAKVGACLGLPGLTPCVAGALGPLPPMLLLVSSVRSRFHQIWLSAGRLGTYSFPSTGLLTSL